MLPVCLGKATKVCGLLTDKDKTYRAVVKLGVMTNTEDMTGEIPVSYTHLDVYKRQGMNGARVNAVVDELYGEKIDIVEWNEDPAIFIEHALSPSKVVSVTVDPSEKSAERCV